MQDIKVVKNFGHKERTTCSSAGFQFNVKLKESCNVVSRFGMTVTQRRGSVKEAAACKDGRRKKTNREESGGTSLPFLIGLTESKELLDKLMHTGSF